jgi:hypothetical protein
VADAVVYALLDPDTYACRYVGQTTQGCYTRLREHMSTSLREGSADYNTHKSRWIRKLTRAGKRPVIRKLTVVDVELLGTCERYWIHYLRSVGCELTNITEGGTGGDCGGGAFNKAKTVCPRGHAYSDSNTYEYQRRGGGINRQCIVCKKLNDPKTTGKGQGTHNKVKTHCPRGHEYNADNTYVYKTNRKCKKCMRLNSSKYRAAKRVL